MVLAAKTADALRLLNEKMKNREIEKYYLCLIHGTLAKKDGILEGFSEKDREPKQGVCSLPPRFPPDGQFAQNTAFCQKKTDFRWSK